MIITISGKPGSGKSTVAKLVAAKLGFRHYSTGEFFRKMAAEQKMSLIDFSKLCEKDRAFDIKTDKWQSNLGKKEDNFVIDARLGFHFIPRAKKIFLDITPEEAAKRIFSDKARFSSIKKAEEQPMTIYEELKLIKRRQKSERMRYKDYYCIDLYGKKNFDLVVDTTNLTIQEVVDKVIAFVK